MIQEWPGQIRRHAALTREKLQKRLFRPQPQFSFSEISRLYLHRISTPRFDWPATPRQSTRRITVLVTPWLFTAVPYFSIEMGRMLAAAGADVTYLQDFSNLLHNAAHSRETARVQEILDQLKVRAKVAELPPASDTEIPEKFLPLIENIAYENAVRTAGGESGVPQNAAGMEKNVSALCEHLKSILAFLRGEKPDLVFLPGGVFGISGLYVVASQISGTPFTTFDSGVGKLLFTHDSIAAHMEDLTVAFRQIYPELDSADGEAVIAYARERLAVRRAGRDVFRLQPASEKAAQKKSYDIFVPLNFRTDTAALLRQKLFKNVQDWLSALLEWVASQPDASVVIRQHPCERISEYRGKDDWMAFLKPFRSRLGKRLRFVSAWDKVNSYDLLENAKVVLPYTSRVGIEASFLGIPVILCAKCYYADLGFAHMPETREEYFNMVRSALDKKLHVGDETRRRAAFLYYLVEECCLHSTVFNPTPGDSMQWINQEPSEFAKDADLLAECLLERKPMPVLLFRKSRISQLQSASQASVSL